MSVPALHPQPHAGGRGIPIQQVFGSDKHCLGSTSIRSIICNFILYRKKKEKIKRIYRYHCIFSRIVYYVLGTCIDDFNGALDGPGDNALCSFLHRSRGIGNGNNIFADGDTRQTL